MTNGYTYVWEFNVCPEMVADFELQYGQKGVWVQLFLHSPDYIETVLLKDDVIPGRYLTVDRWRSKEAFLAFKSEFCKQYTQLDKDCEGLTMAERSLGGFSEVWR